MTKSGNAETAGLTQLLVAWSDGDADALRELTPLVYTELYRLARQYMAAERSHHVLQPTALVNEAWLRLAAWKPMRWQNRGQFFAVTAQMMRHILVDIARNHKRAKRGGGRDQVPLRDADVASSEDVDLVALDVALKRLATVDSRKAQVVELRFFGGLTVEETAEVLGVSPFTVLRDWNLAKAWLLRDLREGLR